MGFASIGLTYFNNQGECNSFGDDDELVSGFFWRLLTVSKYNRPINYGMSYVSAGVALALNFEQGSSIWSFLSFLPIFVSANLLPLAYVRSEGY